MPALFGLLMSRTRVKKPGTFDPRSRRGKWASLLTALLRHEKHGWRERERDEEGRLRKRMSARGCDRGADDHSSRIARRGGFSSFILFSLSPSDAPATSPPPPYSKPWWMGRPRIWPLCFLVHVYACAPSPLSLFLGAARDGEEIAAPYFF